MHYPISIPMMTMIVPNPIINADPTKIDLICPPSNLNHDFFLHFDKLPPLYYYRWIEDFSYLFAVSLSLFVTFKPDQN